MAAVYLFELKSAWCVMYLPSFPHYLHPSYRNLSPRVLKQDTRTKAVSSPQLSRAHTLHTASASCSASICTLQQYACALLMTFTYRLRYKQEAHGGGTANKKAVFVMLKGLIN